MFVAPLPWHRRCASNAMCGYRCVCMPSCTCICVSGSMSVSKRVVSRRLIRYVRYYYNRLWMLSNQRLSSRHSAILSGTQIEFDGCHWVVPALSRSSWVDRRELVVLKSVGCEMLIWTQTRESYAFCGIRVCQGCKAFFIGLWLTIGCFVPLGVKCLHGRPLKTPSDSNRSARIDPGNGE